MLVAVCSAGKATGVTTIATGLASSIAAAEVPTLVVEADTAGGDLAYLRSLNPDEAGVLGFAAAVGSDVSDAAAAIGEHVWQHPASPGCSVMPLTAGGPGVEAQVRALWHDGRDVLARWPGVVLLDLGRYRPGLAEQIWSEVDVGVVISAGSLAGLRRAHIGMNIAPLMNRFATWRVVNGSPWKAEEIYDTAGMHFDAVLDWDRRTADLIRLGNWKAARRRQLGRQLNELAKSITADRMGALA